MHAHAIPIRSSIPAPTSFDKERIKKTAFHDQGILVIDIDDPRIPWQERELLRQVGEKIYGRRRYEVQHGRQR